VRSVYQFISLPMIMHFNKVLGWTSLLHVIPNESEYAYRITSVSRGPRHPLLEKRAPAPRYFCSEGRPQGPKASFPPRTNTTHLSYTYFPRIFPRLV
jgi:hypothetical protein